MEDILANYVHMITGLVLNRKKAETEQEAEAVYPLLTVKNVNDEFGFNEEPFDIFPSKSFLMDHQFTRVGDILMRLTEPHTAVTVKEKQAGALVPSQFIILRVVCEDVLPGYISWYLNSPEAKSELKRAQYGTRIAMTNKKVIQSLPLPIPPLEKQHALLKLTLLYQQEKYLYRKLLDEKERWFQGVTKQLLNS